MKKFFNLLCLAAFTTSIFVACSKNETVENLPEKSVKKVNFSAKSSNPSTKTAFGDKTDAGYPTVWTANEKVKISLNFKKQMDAEVTPSSDGKTATFTATFADTMATSPYVFYSVSPAASVISVDESHASIQIDFPATQKPTLKSVEEKAHIMAAKSATFNEFPEETTPVTLTFSHLAAYGKFQFRNLPETVTINSIELVAEEEVSGRFYFYPSDGSLAANSAGKSVTLNVEDLEIDKNNTTDFWFSFKPVNLEGKTLKIAVHTDAGVYAKTITFPTGKGNFQAGRVATFTVNMSGITPGEDNVYVLLTDKKQLLPGAKAIIVAKDYEKAISTTQNGNNRAQTDVDKSDDKKTITNPAEAVQVFVLEAGTVSNTVAFKCENGSQAVAGKYIYAASSGSNYLKSQDTKDGNASFSVTIEDGYTVLKASGENTHNIIKYNSSNNPPIFSCYASGQKEVVVYVLEGSGEGSSLIDDPKCPTPEISFNSSTNTVTITCSASGARIGYTTDGTTPGIDDDGNPIGTTQEYTEPFTITETCTVKAFAGAPGYNMSDIAEKECEVSTPGSDFTTVAQLNALAATAGDYSGTLTNAVISFVPDTKNAVIKDATGSTLVFVTDHGLLQGQTLTGPITVTATMYHNCAEITALTANFTGSQATVAPQVFTLSQLVGNLSTYQSAYVQVNDLEVTGINDKNISVKNGSNTYVVYAAAGVPSGLAEGDVITAVGTIAWYNNNDQIKVWSTDGITITQAHTPTAHAVTFTQPSAGGSFTIKVNGSAISSGTEVLEGTVVTLTATPASGYNFTSWTVTGATLSGNTATTTFTMGTSEVEISAQFNPVSGDVKTYTLTIGPSDFNTTSYAANNNSKTSTASSSDGYTTEVSWTSNQVMKQGSDMQWQKNNGLIYNTTDLGTIKSVTVTSSAGTFTTTYGASAQPDGTTVGGGYFQVKVGNATGKTSKIEVVFEK